MRANQPPEVYPGAAGQRPAGGHRVLVPAKPPVSRSGQRRRRGVRITTRRWCSRAWSGCTSIRRAAWCSSTRSRHRWRTMRPAPSAGRGLDTAADSGATGHGAFRARGAELAAAHAVRCARLVDRIVRSRAGRPDARRGRRLARAAGLLSGDRAVVASRENRSRSGCRPPVNSARQAVVVMRHRHRHRHRGAVCVAPRPAGACGRPRRVEGRRGPVRMLAGRLGAARRTTCPRIRGAEQLQLGDQLGGVLRAACSGRCTWRSSLTSGGDGPRA